MNTNTPITKERTHLFSPSINIAMIATIVGDISNQVLSTAINSAVLNNEILSCKIALNNSGEAFYQKIERPIVNIQEFFNDWKEVVRNQESIVFDLANGEMLRFFIKREENNIQLLIIAHHIIGDGLAISYLIDDIMTALNGCKLTYKPIKLFDANSVPANSRLNPLMNFMLNNMNKKWAKTGKQFTFDEYKKMFADYWENRSTEIICDEINQDEMLALKRIAKQYNITLNSMVTTAFAKSAKERSDIGLAASVRPKGFCGMGNYATGISIQYQYNTAINFYENAQKVHSLIYAKLNNNRKKFFLLHFMNKLAPTLIDSAYFYAYGKYQNKTAKSICSMFGYNGNPKSISITNLTKLDIANQCNTVKLKDIKFVAPLVPNARRLIGISTFDNKMSVSFHVENNMDMAEEKEFFINSINELKLLSKQ